MGVVYPVAAASPGRLLTLVVVDVRFGFGPSRIDDFIIVVWPLIILRLGDELKSFGARPKVFLLIFRRVIILLCVLYGTKFCFAWPGL